jgi:ABC-2 type transport system permease protein
MLLLHETIHQLRLFTRRPAAVFFVTVLPVVLLVIFTEIFGTDVLPGQTISTAQFYTPALAVFGVVTACYTYLGVATATARDTGVLKRVRGTPLLPVVYIAARVIAVSLIAILSAIIVVGIGVGFYDVELVTRSLAAACALVIVGSACFAALGMLVCALCKSSDTVIAITNATLLPLAFVSEIFIRPERELPDWMVLIADALPLKHFSDALQETFKPSLEGAGFVWSGEEATLAILPELTILVAWGIGAALVASFVFKWDPKGG